MPDRLKYMKGHDGRWIHENDDGWPSVLVHFDDGERIIYSADGKLLILQSRCRNLRNDGWLKWVTIKVTKSHEEMRRIVESWHPFPGDIENLDAICLKTDDGEYVDHSH